MKAISFGKFFPNFFSFGNKISEFLANRIARPVKFDVAAGPKSLTDKTNVTF